MHLGRDITHECLRSQLISVLSSFKCSPMMENINDGKYQKAMSEKKSYCL